MKTIKYFTFAIAMTFTMSANAQRTHHNSSNRRSSTVPSSRTEKQKTFTHEVSLYVQDGWGLGYQFRKTINENTQVLRVGWNIFGLSYQSSFDYGPADYGLLNCKLLGYRLESYSPRKADWFRMYADFNLGYSLSYVKIPKISVMGQTFGGKTETNHFALYEVGIGFQFWDRVTVGYNMQAYYHFPGNNLTHWAKISFLF